MESLKEECLIWMAREGILVCMGARYLTNAGSFTGVLNAEEQQLHIQKGEQESSPQLFECCSWSECS